MRHADCKNYINLDCEKGLCALFKGAVPLDGEGSAACARFTPAEKCSTCAHFAEPDRYGLGVCSGLGKPNWAYASMSACTCTGFQVG
nr:4-hydroxyphenylacetate decarboxylase small subunit [uncultured Holophaga sp.]